MISVEFLDGDDVVDPGTVTVGVDRADGTELVAAGAATGGSGAEARTYQLTAADTGQVDVLKATWTRVAESYSVVTYHPVVGGFYVDLGTLRSTRGLTDETKFSDVKLDAARDWWLTLVDDYCGQSFVPMHGLWTSPRPWVSGSALRLPRPHVRSILSASIAGTAVDTSGWVVSRTGRVYTSDGDNPAISGTGFLSVSFEHGFDYPDVELYDAGVKAMRAKLLEDRTGEPSRSLVVSNEFGTQRESRPGATRATGYPDVDAVLNRRRATDMLVA